MRLKKLLAVVLMLTVLWCGMGITPAYAAYNMPYYVDVDLTNQMVTVYHTKDGSIARQMICSTGTKAHTPTGTWYMPTKDRPDERTEWYWMPNAYTWVKYASKIYYAYFFHSVLFSYKGDRSPTSTSLYALGSNVSHGCIRLAVDDARWIYEHCTSGMKVVIV